MKGNNIVSRGLLSIWHHGSSFGWMDRALPWNLIKFLLYHRDQITTKNMEFQSCFLNLPWSCRIEFQDSIASKGLWCNTPEIPHQFMRLSIFAMRICMRKIYAGLFQWYLKKGQRACSALMILRLKRYWPVFTFSRATNHNNMCALRGEILCQINLTT